MINLLISDSVHESSIVEKVSNVMLCPYVKSLSDENGHFVKELIFRSL